MVNWFIDIAIIQIMAKQQKFYVVWKGVEPGIYTSWTDCQLQIKNYKGAIYKSFTTREEAEHAFATPAYVYLKKSQTATHEPEEKKIPENFDLNCLAVDAASAVIQDQWSTGECIYLPDRKFFILDLCMAQIISENSLLLSMVWH